MFPFGWVPSQASPPVSADEEKLFADGIPRMCILRKVDHPQSTWCGRGNADSSREAFFTSGQHAVAYYKDGKYLRVCENCASAFEAADANSSTNSAPSMYHGMNR